MDQMIEIYKQVPKDLNGRDKRLTTMEGLKEIASDVVDTQDSVKSFIENQLDEITKLYDDFWEKNADAENNPYSKLLDLFTELYHYSQDNDFEDVVTELKKVVVSDGSIVSKG